MSSTNKSNLSKMSKICYAFGIALLLSGFLFSAINLPVNVSASADKVVVCHWTEAQKYVSVDVSASSVTSLADWLQNGHGGHVNDIWPSFIARNGDVIPAYGDQTKLANDCGNPTATATNTVTATASATPTNTLTPTATATVTNTVTSTFTPTVTDTVTATFTPTVTDTFTPTSTGTVTETFTPTAVPQLPLSTTFACFIDYMEWSVTNPNTFPVTVTWELDPSVTQAVNGISGNFLSSKNLGIMAALASGVVTINAGDTVVVTSSTPATHVLKISYLLGEGQELTVDQTSNGTSFCVKNNNPESTPTPVPTLQKPVTQSGGVLIPVTGADLMGSNLLNIVRPGKILYLLGFLSIGLGMVFQGISKK
jgi:hypothetical protein